MLQCIYTAVRYCYVHDINTSLTLSCDYIPAYFKSNLRTLVHLELLHLCAVVSWTRFVFVCIWILKLLNLFQNRIKTDKVPEEGGRLMVIPRKDEWLSKQLTEHGVSGYNITAHNVRQFSASPRNLTRGLSKRNAPPRLTK